MSELIFTALKNKWTSTFMFWCSFYSRTMLKALLKVKKLFKVSNSWLRLDRPQICGQHSASSVDRLVLLETEPLHGDTVKQWGAILSTFLNNNPTTFYCVQMDSLVSAKMLLPVFYFEVDLRRKSVLPVQGTWRIISSRSSAYLIELPGSRIFQQACSLLTYSEEPDCFLSVYLSVCFLVTPMATSWNTLTHLAFDPLLNGQSCTSVLKQTCLTSSLEKCLISFSFGRKNLYKLEFSARQRANPNPPRTKAIGLAETFPHLS